MRTTRTQVDIYDYNTDYDKENLKSIISNIGESVEDLIRIEDKVVIVRDTIADLKFNQDEDFYHGIDVNIAIASAITAGARVFMSAFKNNPDLELDYSDTDSLVIDKELPKHLVGDKLGQLK